MPLGPLQHLARSPLLSPLPWAVAAGYLVVFLLLDWASFIRPLQGLNITPWNPQPALAVTLLLASRRLWWVVLAALLAAEVLVRGVPGDLLVAVLAAAALTCSYLAIAAALRHLLGGGWRLGGARDVAAFMAALAAGAALSGAVYVGTYTVGGYPPPGPLWAAIARYWVGDAVGMMVALPILLALLDSDRRRRMRAVLVRPHAAAIGGVIGLLLWLLFGGGDSSFDLSYLLLLPVIWASLSFGAVGAVLASAATQLGLIVAVQTGPLADLFVFQLQLLVATITVTGLMLGVVVDERARADAELRRTLRLAAAGEMSAALAHELSQPLNALTLYAQAAETLASAPAGALADAAGGREQRLLEVVQRMAHDARRAGDVVKRLRDFFRTGATHLERIDPGALLGEAVRLQRQRIDASGARVVCEAADDLPRPWADAVQLQVVLRNLLANALDAALEAAPADSSDPTGLRRTGAQVTLRCTRRGDELLFAVDDSGAGVSEAQAQLLLEPGGAGRSSKAEGMGVGLSISRAIVEAHGGRLWVEPARGGRFRFTLPLDRPEPDAES